MEEKREAVTVYLPESLLNRLDRKWLERRVENKKARKYEIVQEALERFLHKKRRIAPNGHCGRCFLCIIRVTDNHSYCHPSFVRRAKNG